MIRKWTLLGGLLVLLLSCNNGPRLAKTVEHELAAIDYLFQAGLTVNLALPSDYGIIADQEQRRIYDGKDIVKYFGRIPGHILAPHSWDDNSDEAKDASERFYATLRLLEDYVKGRTTEYPYEAVYQQICQLTSEYAGADSEAYGENLLVEVDLVLTRFADVAFKYCPDLTKIATQVSDDGKAAVMRAALLSYRPIFTFKIFKSSEGVNFRIEHEDSTWPSQVTHFQHLSEESGVALQYYLFHTNVDEASPLHWSNDLDLYVCSEDGSLRWVNLFDETNRELASNWLSLNPSENPYYVVFSPEECKWQFCKKNKKGYCPVPGMPSLCINFNPLCLEIVQ